MRGRETDMGPQFFQTRMGQRYYEVTAPKIATELARLADNVAALNETLTRPRILIVDDDERILRGLGRVLKQTHDVLLATSPAVALAMAEMHKPEAIVTDHDLHDANGHDGIWLLAQLRDHVPNVRRILMSGGQPAIDEHVKDGLVHRFLPKPVAAKDVLGCLGESPPKLCVKCGEVVVDPQLQGEERCSQCGEGL